MPKRGNLTFHRRVREDNIHTDDPLRATMTLTLCVFGFLLIRDRTARVVFGILWLYGLISQPPYLLPIIIPYLHKARAKSINIRVYRTFFKLIFRRFQRLSKSKTTYWERKEHLQHWYEDPKGEKSDR